MSAADRREQFDSLLNGYRSAQVIMTAERLGVFPALSGATKTAEGLAQELGASVRGMRILCDALAALGLLTKQAGDYGLSALAWEFLVPGHPQSQNALVQHGARLYERWGRLHDVIKTGEPVDDRVLDSRWQGSEVAFAQAMASSAAWNARETAAQLDLADVQRMMDLGGGPGAYAIEFARKYPGLQVVVFDRQQTINVARANIEQAQLSDRVSVRAGDLLADDLGGPYDYIFISNLVHVFSAADNAALIRKAAGVLAAGGRMAVKDFVLAPDRTSPVWACLFAINMLVNTPHGDCYTAVEINQWYVEAGLQPEWDIEVPPSSRILLARKPAAATRELSD